MRSYEETPFAPRRPYEDYVDAKQEVCDIAMVIASRYRTGELEPSPYLRTSLVAAADRVLQLRAWLLRDDPS